MDAGILEVAGKIAGIGGLAIGVFLLLFRDVIHKNIFPNLDKEKAYRLLRLIVILVWSIAVVGIGAWAYVKTKEFPAPSENRGNPPGGQKEYQLAGLVTDAQGNGISDVDVLVIGGGERTGTTTTGTFSLTLKREGETVVVLRAIRAGYKPWTDNIKIPNTTLVIKLEAGTSVPTNQVVSPPEARGNPPPGSSGPQTCSLNIASSPSGATIYLDGVLRGETPKNVELVRGKTYALKIEKAKYHTYAQSIDCETGGVNASLKARTGKIYLRYIGDPYGCVLNLKIRIGDKSIVPTANLFPAEDVELGQADYEIQGEIRCLAAGLCAAAGSGAIDVRDGATYDVVWQNTAYARCDVRLVGH